MSDHAASCDEPNSPATPRPRSVKDFATEADLREALSRVVQPSLSDSSSTCETSRSSSFTLSCPTQQPAHCSYSLEPDPYYDIDWRVDHVDRAKSYSQTVEKEMNRLLVLKSYLELDYEAITARNCAFDRLASLAKRSFNAPGCFVFLLDIGRSWALSQEGKTFNLVPRKDTFCCHVIISTEDCFVVPDTTQDPRFQNSAYVKAENGVRFYAACPLKSPEGFNIGTFSIVDTVPRAGLSEEDQEALKDFARLTMDALVHQRELFRKRKELESATRRLASASHDLLTPLSVVQLSISVLNEDNKFLDRLDSTQREYFKAVSSSSAVMAGVCQSLRRKMSGTNDDLAAVSDASATCSEMQDDGDSEDSSEPSCIRTSDLMERLNELSATVMTDGAVPLSLSVDESVPPVWVGNEVQILHISLHLLANSMERTAQGQVRFNVHVDELNGQREIVFECTDTAAVSSTPGELVAIFEEQVLSSYSSQAQVTREHEYYDGRSSPLGILSSGCEHHSDLHECFPSVPSNQPTLDPFSTQIRALGGCFGVCKADSSHTTFWFSIPLLLPDEIGHRANQSKHDDAVKTATSNPNEGAIRRVLVVDDSIIMRKMLCRALEQLGYETFQAADGMEGLKLMRERTYDFVLLDFLMPVMDGLDCVRAFRQWENDSRRGVAQFICGMSAHASPDDVDRGLLFGMTDYRPKPLNLDDLRKLQGAATRPSRPVAIIPIPNQAAPSESAPEPILATVSSFCASVPESCHQLERPLVKVCLLATRDGENAKELEGHIAEIGWHCVVTHSGYETLRLLKTRNWGAVILDSDISDLNGLKCISSFRQWEKHNRVHRQNNMFLMGVDSKKRQESDQMFMIQLPEGVDAAVERPTNRNELACILNRIVDRSFFSEQDIITTG